MVVALAFYEHTSERVRNAEKWPVRFILPPASVVYHVDTVTRFPCATGAEAEQFPLCLFSGRVS